MIFCEIFNKIDLITTYYHILVIVNILTDSSEVLNDSKSKVLPYRPYPLYTLNFTITYKMNCFNFYHYSLIFSYYLIVLSLIN